MGAWIFMINSDLHKGSQCRSQDHCITDDREALAYWNLFKVRFMDSSFKESVNI